MADWKQITARIRRARTSKDPATQLSNLFQKTRDAMVAFELARYFETSGQNTEAAQWYSAAAERFRRADWKTKAKEAAVRLGAEPSAQLPAPQSDEFQLTPPPAIPTEPPLAFEQSAPEPQQAAASVLDGEPQAASAPPPREGPGRGGRRRGRRGGRGRRKGAAPASSVAPSPAHGRAPAYSPGASRVPESEHVGEPVPLRVTDARSIPRLPIEPAAELTGSGLRGRSGDPGLSSRLSLLEMQLRRLLTCPPAKLDDAALAPVGPGVFVLTDSDLTSYYYVEACQTLRIAIGNLLRTGASRRDSDSIKQRLAEHLGIPESRVTKYLADHCVVRWLQLDEGASHFAHFVIAVIRPTLNE
jgi:hypothetical protein